MSENGDMDEDFYKEINIDEDFLDDAQINDLYQEILEMPTFPTLLAKC